jgi:aquaporin Z
MFDAFKNHWPEYLIEAWCLGTFMVSACFFGVLLFNPNSPTATLGFMTRNLLMGLAMGATAVGIITSPWGKRSGAHFNPAVTLTFLRLGKIDSKDAAFYILFQFIGGTAGVLLSWFILQDLLANDAVNFVATVPGSPGLGAAFAGELIISFFMMTVILVTGKAAPLSRFTPLIAGCLLAAYIAIESPISGTSMNPARTFASALISGHWTGWWIYFTAPTIAMLGASECFLRAQGLRERTGHRFGLMNYRRDAKAESPRKFRMHDEAKNNTAASQRLCGE